MEEEISNNQNGNWHAKKPKKSVFHGWISLIDSFIMRRKTHWS